MVWTYKFERRKSCDGIQLMVADDVQLFELSVRPSWVIGVTSWFSDALRQQYYLLIWDEVLTLQTLSAAIRYTLSTTPSSPHPLPRQPPLAMIRNNDFFKTLNLIASEFRHINIPPNPSLPSRTKAGQSGRGCFSSITYHATNMIFHITILDLILYPFYILDPAGLGSP